MALAAESRLGLGGPGVGFGGESWVCGVAFGGRVAARALNAGRGFVGGMAAEAAAEIRFALADAEGVFSVEGRLRAVAGAEGEFIAGLIPGEARFHGGAVALDE